MAGRMETVLACLLETRLDGNSMTGLSDAEKETIISFSAADKTANVYSSDPTWMKKLQKMGGKPRGIGVELEIPKSSIKIVQK